MLSESEGANVDLVLFKVNDDIAVDILNSLKFFEAILISFLLHNWSTIVYCCVLVSSQDQQTHLRKQGKLGYLYAVHLAMVTSSSHYEKKFTKKI